MIWTIKEVRVEQTWKINQFNSYLLDFVEFEYVAGKSQKILLYSATIGMFISYGDVNARHCHNV